MSITNCTITTSVIDQSSITGSTVKQSDISESNIVVGAGKTLDVSLGLIIFANDQISGEKIAGGMADIDISGNSETVTNGIYTTNFVNDHTILKADLAGNPIQLVIPENTFIGRKTDGVINALTLNESREMLDITRRQLYVNNSILKADIASNPEPLFISESTIIGRMPDSTISALTKEQVIELIMSTQVLRDYGAVVRDGQNIMTGSIFTSFERVTMVTGQTVALDVNKETSYVTANYSVANGRVANLTLGAGLGDGHRKVIIMSQISNKVVVELTCNYIAPSNPDPHGFVFVVTGQSSMFQWDSVLAKWMIVNTGAIDMTRDQRADPDWIEKLVGND
jgi:hypothetical protein